MATWGDRSVTWASPSSTWNDPNTPVRATSKSTADTQATSKPETS